MTENQPSRFWKNLGAEHAEALQRHGYEQMKRHQASRYFSWQWRWRQLKASEQFRFLVRRTSPADWARILREPMSLDDKSWSGMNLSRPDRFLTTVAVRLLWRYAERFGDREVLALSEPDLGCPLPIQFRGRLISQDLANSSLELAALRRALPGRPPTRVMEIGAGYGRTAYAVLSLFPECEYTIVDIEPAITISEWYLKSLFDSDRIRFIEAGECAAEMIGPVDLALSISSLQEMTPAQVHRYLQMMNDTCSGGTVFLKQWGRWENPDDGVVMDMARYPIPSDWQCRFWERSPVQTRFVQAAWSVPAGSANQDGPAA